MKYRMTRVSRSHLRAAILGITAVSSLPALGCALVYGIGDYEVDPAAASGDASDATSDRAPDSAEGDSAPPPECTTNRECTERATLAGPDDAGADAAPLALDGGVVPAVCLKDTGRCARLLSPDCTSIYGDYQNDDSIVLATLLSTSGALLKTNAPRQQSVIMAAEEINSSLGGGGIPAAIPGGPVRPVVVLSCNAAVDLTRAGTHLVDDLHVPAIVGPNLSQDTLDFTAKFASKRTSVIMSPAATASSIASTPDSKMTWCMPPSDTQRAKLTIRQINDIEGYLHGSPPGGTRNGSLKLAIVYRDDAFGQSTSSSISGELTFNGKPISDPANVPFVKTYKYSPSSVQTQTDAATAVAAFAPDVIALFGTSESITNVFYPLEKKLEAADPGGAIRPYYALIDPNKVKELTDGLGQSGLPTNPAASLRPRIRGVGVITTGASAPVFATFNSAYQARWGDNPRVANMSTSYDIFYAYAYALAATTGDPVSGVSVAKGLALLGSGTEIPVGRATTLKAFQALTAGEPINPIGSFGHLRWDADGNIAEGLLDVWCIGTAAGAPTFESSGMTMDISAQSIGGTYKQCD